MSTLPMNPRSERGVALIIVLLLSPSCRPHGYGYNSQVEAAKPTTDVTPVRACCRGAGLNRAVTAILEHQQRRKLALRPDNLQYCR